MLNPKYMYNCMCMENITSDTWQINLGRQICASYWLHQGVSTSEFIFLIGCTQ